MKQGLTEAVCIIDMTGSMQLQTNDTIGGFNNFVEEQRKLPGECRLTVKLFNHANINDKPWLNGKMLSEVPKMDESIYRATGNTPLFDAIGNTITAVGKRLADTPEADRPERVLVVIMTDGQENWSDRFTLKQIVEMIKHQRDVYKWEFIFLGADLDSFGQGAQMGMAAANYCCNTRDAYNMVSNAVSSYRTSGTIGGFGGKK